MRSCGRPPRAGNDRRALAFDQHHRKVHIALENPSHHRCSDDKAIGDLDRLLRQIGIGDPDAEEDGQVAIQRKGPEEVIPRRVPALSLTPISGWIEKQSRPEPRST